MHDLRGEGRVPGELGIWVFVLGDMTVFALFFAVYMFYRGQDPEHYVASQQTLDQALGAVNTLLLLASSWFVALGVNVARERRGSSAATLFGWAWLCGLAFVAVKVY